MSSRHRLPVLVLTQTPDAHADRVIERLVARDVSVVRFDPADYPASPISVAYGSHGLQRIELRRPGEPVVRIDEVRGAWVRRPGAAIPHSAVTDERHREFVARDAALFLTALWNTLDCPWLPASPLVASRAQHKVSQLRLAAELGFELPPTVISNDPDELVAFYLAHDGAIISKPATFAFSDVLKAEVIRYTEPVTRRDLLYRRAFRYHPMILQANVPKRLELRVTVVGERVFTAAIHSQDNSRTRTDWRRYNDFRTRHERYPLPLAVERRCLALLQALGLRYGAFDFIVTPDDRYVFLEVNPNGQFLWIEELTGLPISDAIAELLAADGGSS